MSYQKRGAITGVCCLVLAAYSVLAQPMPTEVTFVSKRDGGMNIYNLRLADGQVRQLTRGESDYAPAWSADGQYLAFNSHRSGGWKIWVVNADGTDARRLTTTSSANFNYEYYPAWSPDGTHIAFEKWDNRASNFEIHVVRRDGTQETNLTRHAAHDRQPAWSPDGSHLVFTSQRDGQAEIYRMRADGSGVQNLTEHRAVDYAPAWSPDGRFIIFHSNREGTYATYRMRADGTHVERVPGINGGDHRQGWGDEDSNTKSIPFDAVRSTQNVWSASGHVVFTSVREGNKDVYWVDMQTGERQRVTRHPSDDFMPVWRK